MHTLHIMITTFVSIYILMLHIGLYNLSGVYEHITLLDWYVNNIK